jgi:cytochrome c oxidase subunit I
MATEVLEKVESPTTYLNNGHTVKSWLLTLDHKRIALLYLFSISIFFLIGGIYAALIRLELVTPEGDLLTPDTYNRVFTMHGVIMIFFFLIPSIPAVLGNFLLPIMLGAKDVAFPKLNLLSWYVFMVGGALMMYTLINGGIDTGWTFYPPYSSIYSNSEVTMAGVSIFITGFSSILTGLNFMVTIHTMRAPGLTWFRLPLFVWAHYATSLIQILGTPVIAITVLALALERSFQIGIFDPKLGGDPVLFQHMFWFYSHPAVYIMILPSMGVISEIIATSTRKRIFGYHFVAFSSLAIAVFGFLVWGHHMFTSSQSMYAGMVFSIISYAVAIPSAIKTFNWLATIYKGSVSFNTPMIYALAFLGLFTIGGMTGLFLSALGLDVHLHDTYFVVAHFHYVMVGGAIIGYLGAIHYWWPKITGKMYPETLGRISAAIIFIGFNFTFFPQFILGYLGMPRRYYAYVPEFQVLHVLSSGGALVLGVGFILPLFYLTWSIKYGKKAPNNPWMAYGLEWQTSSPPPTENFTFDPVVTTEAYEYEHVEEIRNAGKSAGLQTA